MMNKTTAATAGKVGPATGQAQAAQPMEQPMELSEEDRSKDQFFAQIAEVAEAMIAKHGKDFTMGTLLLTAKFIADGKPLSKRTAASGEAARVGKAV
jgi:hypothetical protein